VKIASALSRLFFPAAVLLLAGITSADEGHDAATPDTAAVDTAAYSNHPLKVARAMRASTAPDLDGRLDDAVWSSAPVQSGFVQRDPDAGTPSSEKTEFMIVYDDEAIYIGAMMYDSAPDSISTALARRDDWRNRDDLSINIDPHHDHQTGHFFVVGPSGYMGDGTIFNDGWDDDSWDGVWEARTAILDNGWSAEIKIPYHVLRFSPNESYTWGIQVMRDIARKNEWTMWSYYPRGLSGWVSRFGHLEGIEGIEPPRSLEIFPFGLGRVTMSPGEDGGSDETDLFATAGVDVRYGITSNISLNGTINPDFGQVEADPAVLNLSVFETFFRERRPFFLEGISIFENPGPNIVGIDGPTRLFHSRRIGRRPGRFDLPDDSEELTRPDNSTILGAVKVSGKTEHRTAFGIINAVTSEERARIEEYITDSQTGAIDTLRRNVRVEPYTNYFVGRVQQDLLNNSSVGAQLTAVNGQDFEAAYVGAVDGHLKWNDNAWQIYSRLAGSRAGQDEDRGSGYEGSFYFTKNGGSLGGQFYADARSEGFDANDLGFMNRNGIINTGAHVFYEMLEPYWLGRRSGYNLNVWHRRNYDSDELARGVNFNMWNRLHNFWGFNFGVSHDFRVKDDLNTRGGPVMVRPALTWFWASLWTDDRGNLSGDLFYNGNRGQNGDQYNNRLGFEVEWRPVSNIEIEIEPSLAVQKNTAQWVDNIDIDADDEDDRFIFGELDNRTFELEMRASYAYSPTLSLQLFMQPFVTTGEYSHIKELARPNSFAFIPYTDALEENPDFSRRALRSNLVLRWEYGPGSTIFVVWQQSRDWEQDLTRAPDFEPLNGLGNSFTDEGNNIFLVKMNRWIGL
jgi:hypothetical protein